MSTMVTDLITFLIDQKIKSSQGLAEHIDSDIDSKSDKKSHFISVFEFSSLISTTGVSKSSNCNACSNCSKSCWLNSSSSLCFTSILSYLIWGFFFILEKLKVSVLIYDISNTTSGTVTLFESSILRKGDGVLHLFITSSLNTLGSNSNLFKTLSLI